jgi:outer membrane immunogenic protein
MTLIVLQYSWECDFPMKWGDPMRMVLGLAGAALLFAGPAVAADLAVQEPVYKAPVYKAPPPAPVYWTGCYVGATAGGVSGRSDVSWAPDFSNAELTGQTAASLRSTSFTGGGEAGCNYQVNTWLVVGVEADGEYTGLGSAKTGVVNTTNPPLASPFTESFSSRWLATVRGRVGVASGQWLFFASGGAAFANSTFSDAITFPTGPTNSSTTAATSSGTITGWTAGGGIEWLFSPHWSLKAEYLHVDFGTRSFLGINSQSSSTILFNHTLTEEIGRVGVNYHF